MLLEIFRIVAYTIYISETSRLGKKNVRDNMLQDSQSECPINKSKLDKNLNLFNCQNGTLNLKTFEFSNHKASDFLSKITNVEYDKSFLPHFQGGRT